MIWRHVSILLFWACISPKERKKKAIPSQMAFASMHNFPCIEIGNFLILVLTGMERKQDAEAVEVFIQIGSGCNVVRPPQAAVCSYL